MPQNERQSAAKRSANGPKPGYGCASPPKRMPRPAVQQQLDPEACCNPLRPPLAHFRDHVNLKIVFFFTNYRSSDPHCRLSWNQTLRTDKTCVMSRCIIRYISKHPVIYWITLPSRLLAAVVNPFTLAPKWPPVSILWSRATTPVSISL